MNKKKLSNHKIVLIIALLIGLQIIRMFYWGTQKESIYEDEFFTYDNAMNVGNPEGAVEADLRWDKSESFIDQFHTRSEFMERFSFDTSQSVLQLSPVQFVKKLLSVKTYYILFNMVMSLFPGEFSIWYCIGMNMILFILAQILVYKIADKIFENQLLALMAVALYGFCGGAVTTVIYVRFYMLYTLCCLFCFYCHMRLVKKEGHSALNIAGIFLSVFIGFRNAEYTLVFAFMMAVSYLVVLCMKKRWKDMAYYVGSYGVAGLLYLFIFPQFLEKFKKGQALSAVNNLIGRDVEEYIQYMREYFRFTQRHVWGSKYVLVLFLIMIVVLIIVRKRMGEHISFKQLNNKGLIGILFGTVAGYYLIIMKIIPSFYWRYISNMFPLVMLIILLCMSVMIPSKYRDKGIVGLTCIFIVYMLLSGELYIDQLHHGVTETTRQEVLQKCGTDNYLYLHSEEDPSPHKSTYYTAYCLPDETQMYVTTLDTLLEKDNYDAAQDDIILWVYDKEWQENSTVILERLGKTTGELIMEMPGTYCQAYRCY